MSSDQMPKIPDRPMRRRRTTDELNTSGDTPNSPNPALIANLTDSSTGQNNELPIMPSRRPSKSQTNPALPTMPPIEPPSRCKSQNELVEEKAPRIPLVRPSRVTTDEKLEDILQSTNEQLEEMQDLISKHDIGNERKVPSKASAANSAMPAMQNEDPSLNIFEQRGFKDELVEKSTEGSKVGAGSEESGGTSLDRTIVRKEDSNVSRGTSGGEEPALVKSLQNEPASDVDFESKSSESTTNDTDGSLCESDKKKKNGPNGSLLNTSVASGEEEGVVDIPYKSVKMREDQETVPTDFVLNREDSAETDLVKLGIGSTDNLVEDGTTTKRTAPPVPKKPSSRIAAFQEMLQKQQLEQIHGNFRRTDPMASKDSADSATDSVVPEVPHRRPSDNKSKFAQNLNGIFALPGMVPSGELPASLSRKLGQTPSSEEESNSNDMPLGDVRHSRARGPRGRKLPSKVSNVKKVSSLTASNEIEVFNTWNIVYTKERKNRMKLQDMTSSRREIPHYLSDSIEGLINAGIQERRPSLSETQANKEASSESDNLLVVNEAAALPEGKVIENSEGDELINDEGSKQLVAHESDDHPVGHSLSDGSTDILSDTEEDL